MRSLYQPARARRPAPLLLLATLATGACTAPPAAREAAPELAPRRDPLTSFLATFEVEPAGALEQRAVAGTRWSGDGPRAVRVGPAPAALSPLLPGSAEPSRALGVLGGDRVLLEAAATASGTAPRWYLVGPGSAQRLLGPPPGERWRLLGPASGRLALFIAAQPLAGGPEQMLELAVGGESRSVASAPPGFAFAAATGDGLRVALVRRLDERADELYWLDRPSGETRLLLPEGNPGRFRPLEFSADGRRLLLLCDDGSDLPRAEWLELATRARRPLGDSPCATLGAHLGPDGSLALELSCAGRSELLWLDGESGAERAAPTGPSASRVVALWPGAPGAPLLFALAGSRWPRDLWWQDADRDARPLTYGLAPRIDASDLIDARPLSLPTPDGALPAELWVPRRSGPGGVRAGLLWLESDARPPRWFEWSPFFQYLAQRGIAVLRLRPRGSDGFGRRFRLLGDGRRGEVELADIESGRRALLERTGAEPDRLALVGEGPWNGALAVAVAGRADPGFAIVAAIDPDPDPLGLLDAPPATESEAERRRERFGDPADPALARRRAVLRLGATPPRVPLRVVLDGATAPGAAARALLEAAAASGGLTLWYDLPAPQLDAPRLDSRLALLLDQQIRPALGAARAAGHAP